MKHDALNMMPKAKFAMKTANNIPMTQEITMKTMLITFFNIEGSGLFEFIPQDETAIQAP
jgi:hypothetical protein